MSSSLGAMLLTVSLTGSVGDGDKLVLPRPILEAGLKQASSAIAQRAA